MLQAWVKELNRLVGPASLNCMNAILIAGPRSPVACSQPKRPVPLSGLVFQCQHRVRGSDL